MEEIKKKFRRIKESDLEMIMTWRMRPDITKFMYTDPKLTMEIQKRWFEKISNEEDTFYWLIEVGDKAVGLVSLVDWDKVNSIIYTGLYIAEREGRTLQNIIDVNMNMYNFIFDKLNINKAAFKIMSNNIGQIEWAKRMGAKLEGISRQAIRKNGLYYDLYLFSFLMEEWEDILTKTHFNRIEIE